MKLKEIFKHKSIIICIAGLLLLSLILSLVFIKPTKDKSKEESHIPLETESEMTIDVPEFNPTPIDGDSDKKNKAETTDTQNRANLDVGGNSGDSTESANGNSSNNTVVGDSNDNPAQNPPSVDVNVETVGVEPKDAQPEPQPPKPKEGYEIDIDKYENIPVDCNPSVEESHIAMGLVVGSNLEKAGYYSLYTNAGAPREMVIDAVKNYAYTGNVSLTPSNYSLPALVGEYHVKLQVKGSNVAESAEYISDYMKNDKAFNDKVNTVFSQYKDGFLSVYQKDGYFYVLFAVIDKGYTN